MPSWVALAAAGAFVLSLAGCESLSLRAQARRTVSAAVGQPAGMLGPCLPRPALVDTAAGLELLVYRWTPIQESSLHPVERRRVDTGSDVRRLANEVSEFLAGGRLPDYHEYCQLTLWLAGNQVVRGVQVNGRDAAGLNASALCAMRLARCTRSQP